MKGWKMYTELQSLKNLGFSKRQTAEKLSLNFRTIAKYWNQEPDEFEKTTLSVERSRELSLYEGVVTDWLKTHPDMTAAQVHDWLKEHYEITASERAARRYVAHLRVKNNIPKVAASGPRQYMAVEDPPMGDQMQVDFGVVYLRDARTRKYRKLYCIGVVLSHSRYKWGLWRTQPFTTQDFVDALDLCFEYFGGMPKELVFDQDRVLAVSENYGDIIYTHGFEAYKQRMGFSIYLCRGADPESKGKVEAVVKYFKNNYAKNRNFTELDFWNDGFCDWLGRTANSKVHGTTKKIPAEVFLAERHFLKPVPSTKTMIIPIVTRTVHKDNTIFYKGSRYQLPLGTYMDGNSVALEVHEDILKIYDAIDPILLAEYPLAKERGSLVQNTNFKRDFSQTMNELQSKLIQSMDASDEADLFVTQIRRLKPRYARDQMALIAAVVAKHPQTVWLRALTYCITHSLYSAVDFRDAASYFSGVAAEETVELSKNPKVLLHPSIQTQKRPLSDYAKVMTGGEIV
ncbi:MAG: IS21 family transposase [Erysipelotrichaceae bacterium]|nr:IS21 family transposase [Erysipelotrichaceae bacterium]